MRALQPFPLQKLHSVEYHFVLDIDVVVNISDLFGFHHAVLDVWLASYSEFRVLEQKTRFQMKEYYQPEAIKV